MWMRNSKVGRGVEIGNPNSCASQILITPFNKRTLSIHGRSETAVSPKKRRSEPRISLLRILLNVTMVEETLSSIEWHSSTKSKK